MAIAELEGVSPDYAETLKVVSAVKSQPTIAPYARVVGAWIWIEFPEKPDDETREWLKAHGFKWNRGRNAWQNPCGVFRRSSKGHDPRATYGSVPVDEVA